MMQMSRPMQRLFIAMIKRMMVADVACEDKPDAGFWILDIGYAQADSTADIECSIRHPASSIWYPASSSNFAV